jgi:hypothetical protein
VVAVLALVTLPLSGQVASGRGDGQVAGSGGGQRWQWRTLQVFGDVLDL